MNSKEYRFTEIVTTISLLPDDTEEVTQEMLMLPNGTDGLDEDLYRALMTQSMHENDDWRAKFFTTLLNTTMSAVLWHSTLRENDIPNEMHPDQFVDMVQKLNDSITLICQDYGVSA